jgi:hypothetical protein
LKVLETTIMQFFAVKPAVSTGIIIHVSGVRVLLRYQFFRIEIIRRMISGKTLDRKGGCNAPALRRMISGKTPDRKGGCTAHHARDIYKALIAT